MQTKIVFKILSVAIIASIVFSWQASAENQKKYIVLLADWGKKGIPSAVVDVVVRHPGLKIAAAWPADLQPSPADRQLLREKRLEPGLVLSDEPVFPLVYNTVFSSPTALTFSWPGDLWDIVVRNQSEMKAHVPDVSAGLFLRSGAFSGDGIDGLKRLGISWVDYKDGSGRQGAYYKDGLLLLAVPQGGVHNLDELKNVVARSSGAVTVLLFDEKNPLEVPLLEELAGQVDNNPDIAMVTPDELLKTKRDLLLSIEGPVQSDISPWLRKPVLIYKLSIARAALEEYKNSGQAQPRTLDALRGELYNLYRFDLLARLNDSPQPEDEQLFLVGIRNIYMLLKRPVPPELSGKVDELPASAEAAAFAVNVSTSCLTFTNSSSARRPASITALSVCIAGDAIVYTIAVSSAVPALASVDVYMDLNNQRGAGLTNLLNGVAGFLEPKDAWEYAFRIEKGQVSLYRAGRFEVTMVKKFALAQPWTVEIPRAILRGNPLHWGYQAVLLEPNGGTWKIDDFLCRDESQRRKILEGSPLQLPAVREQQQQ
jgi:hypothetical protein